LGGRKSYYKSCVYSGMLILSPDMISIYSNWRSLST